MESEYTLLSEQIQGRLVTLLDKHFFGKQILLAEAMDRSEAEVSKWFSGKQNFTLKTLVKLSVVFGEPVITVIEG